MLMNHGKNSSSSNTNSSRWSSSFTASQWHELEHQALIFKYMSKGLPIPPDLIYPIRRSCPPPFPLLPSFSSSTTSPSSSLLFPHQPNIVGRWGYHQMGLGREPDPEPGRCRRTDGKKWRYFHGLREEVVGEHVFFSEPSGAARNAHADGGGGGWRSTVTVAEEPPAWMTSPPKRKSYSVLESLRGPREQQHCFVLGDDFKPLKVEKEEEGEAKQTSGISLTTNGLLRGTKCHLGSTSNRTYQTRPSSPFQSPPRLLIMTSCSQLERRID
ncbi:Growth-regulating factor 1 [Acorus calamus]|uniref:Growth-regulating factor n=1 Tax=Acorus calamus TaxID=4465 RepID=A0AAV9CFJ7_ACOCL|nr:Growth-regulating factor 1 [Acorus calamus]